MLVAGFDEVGRGAWAGPLLVAGVVIDKAQFTDLKDSKQLRPTERALATNDILRSAHAVALVWSSPFQIDDRGLGETLRAAFNQCARILAADTYIVDGKVDYLGYGTKSQAIIQADEMIPAVAAASVIAKHYRDTYMKLVSHNYSEYGFESHVGYGTKLHMHALQDLGICDLHRKSFKPIGVYV